jgi:hypothetical protein
MGKRGLARLAAGLRAHFAATAQSASRQMLRMRPARRYAQTMSGDSRLRGTPVDVLSYEIV